MTRRGLFLLILAFLAGFFYGPGIFFPDHTKSFWLFYFDNNLIMADDAIIKINEIAWMGSASSSNNEWIELKNSSSQAVNLNGWILTAQDGTPKINLSGTIDAQGLFLLERTDDNNIPGVKADLIYVGALGNAGEVLELRDGQNNLIDLVSASSSWPAGDNEKKLTMARRDNNEWQNSLEVGGTPRQNNFVSSAPSVPQATEQIPQATSTSQVESVNKNSAQKINLGDVVINEFVSDPADGQTEWIELYNKTGKQIDLTGWIIEDGSGAKTILSGTIGFEGPGKFFVVESPKGNLNNGGDIIILRDNLGELVDQVSYGSWNDGDLENNAPMASDPFGVARKFDGQNSFNNKYDFALTSSITKAQSNIIKNEEENNIQNADYDFSQDILITEIFPNPVGLDTEDEFVELYNKGSREVDLLGWKLAGYKFNDKSKIGAGEYLVVYRSQSKIALNNSGGVVELFQPLSDKSLRTVKYANAIEGQSYCLTGLSDWVWSETATPGKKNEIKTINRLPTAEFNFPEEIWEGVPVIFDGSDSVDEDNDGLNYNWSFGDGFENYLASPEHTFFKAGDYVIKLTVGDNNASSTKEKIVSVKSGQQALNSALIKNKNYEIVINELLPNPEGADNQGEWVELYNKGRVKVNLLNWQLDDGEDGSKPYKFSKDLWLDAGEYYLIKRELSNLAFNNTSDSARLFDDSGEMVDEVNYEKTFEGQSLARGDNDKWFWSVVLTPGQKNIISFSDEQIPEDLSGDKNFSIALSGQKDKVFASTTLDEIKNFDVGDLVTVSGVVAVLPGTLGTQYFYIVDDAVGIQVYSYKKDFPSLNVGDGVEVVGELSSIAGEMRVKTKTADDIRILGKKELPQPEKITCEQVVDEMVGSLIMVSGEIMDKKGTTIYLDDGTGEVVIYVKKGTDINLSDLVEGEKLEVTGLLGMTKSGLKLMPRFQEDLVKLKKDGSKDSGQVLGEVAVDNEWELAQRNKKLELFKYLLIVFGGCILLLIGVLVRKR